MVLVNKLCLKCLRRMFGVYPNRCYCPDCVTLRACEKQKVHYNANKELKKSQVKQWRKNNPVRSKEIGRASNSKIRASNPSSERERVYLNSRWGTSKVSLEQKQVAASYRLRKVMTPAIAELIASGRTTDTYNIAARIAK